MRHWWQVSQKHLLPHGVEAPCVNHTRELGTHMSFGKKVSLVVRKASPDSISCFMTPRQWRPRVAWFSKGSGRTFSTALLPWHEVKFICGSSVARLLEPLWAAIILWHHRPRSTCCRQCRIRQSFLAVPAGCTGPSTTYHWWRSQFWAGRLLNRYGWSILPCGVPPGQRALPDKSRRHGLSRSSKPHRTAMASIPWVFLHGL